MIADRVEDDCDPPSFWICVTLGPRLFAASRTLSKLGSLEAQGAEPVLMGGGRIKTEDDPLDVHPPASMSKTLDGTLALERMVTSAEGLTGTGVDDDGDPRLVERQGQARALLDTDV